MVTVTRSGYALQRCCQELDGERHQRENLKILLGAACRDQLPGWMALLSKILSESRRRLNRLWARRSRLQRVGDNYASNER
jgi:hypothetical protein